MAFIERPDDAPLTPRSERVRKVAALSGRSMRSKQGLFRLEGPQAVRALLEFSPEAARELFLTPDAATRHPELGHHARAAGIQPRSVSADVIEAMVREQGQRSIAHPQGVIATAAHIDRPWRALIDALPETGPLTIVVCERLQDPGNAGLLLRTADAAGANAVFFSADSADPFAPKVVRASAGSLMSIPFARKVPLPDLIAHLHARAVTCAATSPHSSTDLFTWNVPERIAWIVGNEAAGLSDEALALADARVRIPLFGRAESLNLATAATLCLFESARRFHTAESTL